MFVPHGRKNTKLGETGFAPDDVEKALIFIVIDTVAFYKLWRDGWFGHGADIPLADMAVLLDQGWAGEKAKGRKGWGRGLDEKKGRARSSAKSNREV
jgi:hypothetical protein